KNWGRILGIVFAFLGGISALFNILSVGTTFALSGGLGAITLIQGIVILGTAVWFLVFAFRADVAAWYTPHSSVGYQQGWSAGGQAGHYNPGNQPPRSEEHTSELQSRFDLVCRLLLEKKT